MNAIEFLFTEQGEPTNFLIKTETLEQEERLKAIAHMMLSVFHTFIKRQYLS